MKEQLMLNINVKHDTFRSAFLEKLKREQNDRMLAVCRLDIWYEYHRQNDSLPEELKGLTLDRVEQRLGFGRSARKGRAFEQTFGSHEVEIDHVDGEIRSMINTSRGVLTSVKYQDADDGTRGLIRKYYIEDKADYLRAMELVNELTFKPTYEQFRKYDSEIDQAGLPLVIAHSSPIHRIMLEFTGYENFYFHIHDYADEVKALVKIFNNKHKQGLWPILAQSPAQFFLHGAHFSSAMTPPPLFREYFVPYFKEFNEYMHAHDKYVAFHCDSDISLLYDEVLECGFDVADCFATDPLAPYSIDEAFAKTNGELILWGGVPSLILDRMYPYQDFVDHIDKLFDAVKSRNDFILGISDNALPGTEWERLLYISKKLKAANNGG